MIKDAHARLLFASPIILASFAVRFGFSKPRKMSKKFFHFPLDRSNSFLCVCVYLTLAVWFRFCSCWNSPSVIENKVPPKLCFTFSKHTHTERRKRNETRKKNINANIVELSRPNIRLYEFNFDSRKTSPFFPRSLDAVVVVLLVRFFRSLQIYYSVFTCALIK